MTEYIITNDDVEIGDIVVYQTVTLINGKSKKKNILGVLEDWYNPTFNRFQPRLVGIDKESTTVYNLEWINKVKIINIAI